MKRVLLIVIVVAVMCGMPYNHNARGFSSMSYTNSRGEIQSLYIGDLDVSEEYEKLLNNIVVDICKDLGSDKESVTVISVTLLENSGVTIELIFDGDKYTYLYDCFGSAISQNIIRNYELDEWEMYRIEKCK